jgi:hypothetical protein
MTIHGIPSDGTWAIVELGDGRRLGGFCRVMRVGPAPAVEVDVPAVDGSPGFLAIHAVGSVARVTPCARAHAEAVALARRPQLGGGVHHIAAPPDPVGPPAVR